MKLALVMLGVSAWGQTVTLSPIRHVGKLQEVSVFVCPIPSAVLLVNAGRVYGAAVQARFAPILPTASAPVVASNVSNDWRNWVLEILDAASLAAAVAISTQAGATAEESNRWLKWVSRVLSFHSVTEFFKARLRAKAPDPASLTAGLLDPDGKLDLSAGCKSSKILSLYGRGIQDVAVKVDISAP